MLGLYLFPIASTMASFPREPALLVLIIDRRVN